MPLRPVTYRLYGPPGKCVATANRFPARPSARRLFHPFGHGCSGLITRFCMGLVLLLPAACAKPVSYAKKGVVTTDGPVSLLADSLLTGDSVSVQYLGCGGLLIRQGQAAVLFDPFFSNAGPFAAMPFRKIKTDRAMVDKIWSRLDTSNISAILVTHAHYDHLMDVPYVHQKLRGQPLIYGSNTTYFTLQHKDCNLPAGKVVDVEAEASVAGRPGKWYYPLPDSSYRFMPLLAEHAPHVKLGDMSIKMFEGRYDTVPAELSRPRDWKEGQTLSYLLDFLGADKKTVKVRLSVITSACAPPMGFLPRLDSADGHPVDISVLCVASHKYVSDYPAKLLRNMNPRFVVASHWEDFFLRYDRKKKMGVRFTNLNKFIGKLNSVDPLKGRWMLPEPLVKTTFRY